MEINSLVSHTTRPYFLDLEDRLDVVVGQHLEPVLSQLYVLIHVQIQLNSAVIDLTLVVLDVTQVGGIVVHAQTEVMRVLVVDQGLEVTHLDLGATEATRDHGVQLHVVVGVLRETSEQLLNLSVVQQFYLRNSQNLEGLLFGHETTFNS